MRHRPHLGLLWLVAFAIPTLAATDPPRPAFDPRHLDPGLAKPQGVEIVKLEHTTPHAPESHTPKTQQVLQVQQAQQVQQVLEQLHGSWSIKIDPRNGRFAFASGQGIPLIPGRGNRLNPQGTQGTQGTLGTLGPRDPRDLQDPQDLRDFYTELEPRIQKFVSRFGDDLLPSRGELVFDSQRSSVRDRGRLVTAGYGWEVDGVRVEHATVFVRLNSGNVTQFGSSLVGPTTVDTTPRISTETARRTVLLYSGDAESAHLRHAPELLIQVEESMAGNLEYRLVWKTIFTIAGELETWEVRVDAQSGEVVGFQDLNHYTRTVGGVYPRSVFQQNEVRVPFPFGDVEVDGEVITADTAGAYAYRGGTAVARLGGRFFTTVCRDCPLFESAMAMTDAGNGLLDLGLGGDDRLGNGLSTPAHRNTFYHLNQVRRLALKWMPGLPWLRTHHYPVNVNLNATCNAFYDLESINFFRAGNGCFNTGEISDIIYHEWGHGLDFSTNYGGPAASEGTADVLATLITRSPEIGLGTFFDGNGFRNLDSNLSELGVLTVDRVENGDCDRPSGGESPHCVGQLYGQSAWELANHFADTLGHHTGWRRAEQLFFHSLPDAGSHLPDSPFSIYQAYLQADDDDGNLANGTPHAQAIYDAFATHQIAGDPLPNSPKCVGPAQPALDVHPVCDRFELSWSPVPGAQRYEVLRTELTGSSQFPVTRLGPRHTGYVDTEVAPQHNYSYVVMAVDAQGCESDVEAPIQARLEPAPELSVIAATANDRPRGNRSGAPDPGEEVDLEIQLVNLGQAPASPGSASLFALTHGVRVIEGRLTWPIIEPGATAIGTGALRFISDDAFVSCGQALRFELTPDDPETCVGDSSFFSIALGAPRGDSRLVASTTDDAGRESSCDPTPACFEAPEFAGVGQVTSGSSCGETQLSWSPAESRCQNAEIRYNIYRSNQRRFDPGPANRIGSAIQGTTFVDPFAPSGQTQYYIVRAEDSRSGEDGNFVIGEGRATATSDIRAPEFGGIRTVTTGQRCGEVRLDWSPATEHCSAPVHYSIYRSEQARFQPSPATWVGSTFNTSFSDTVPQPGRVYHYIVRAQDDLGNETAHASSSAARSWTFDEVRADEVFETSGGGWMVGEPNDAVRGNWEWGDPEGDAFQPEDDATPDGLKCWVTGVPRTIDGNNNDIDFGSTTLISARYDLSGAVDPVVRYARWWTNDRGNNPSDERDTLQIDVSTDDGFNWTSLEVVGDGQPLEWVRVEKPLAGLITPTDRVRFRFIASDIGNDILAAGRVEGAIDDFSLVDRDQGCSTCAPAAEPISQLLLDRVGANVTLHWGDAGHITHEGGYLVYRMTGDDLSVPVPIDFAAEPSFVDTDAARSRRPLFYRVVTLDSCGNPTPLAP